MKSQSLTLDDLPDLSDWGLAPILTIEQAALLWGGIDPAFCRFENAGMEHPQKYRRAYIAMQAFCGGIVLKTLQVHELFLIHYNGESYRANQAQGEFSIEDIDCQRTTVQKMVLLSWAKKEQCLTLKQTLTKQAKKEIANIPPPENIITIEHKPLEPVYNTPEFDAACEVIRKYWNEYDGRGKPTKEHTIQEFIKETLMRLGVEPSKAAIQRIDTLTRPPQFKNQKTKQN